MQFLLTGPPNCGVTENTLNEKNVFPPADCSCCIQNKTWTKRMWVCFSNKNHWLHSTWVCLSLGNIITSEYQITLLTWGPLMPYNLQLMNILIPHSMYKYRLVVIESTCQLFKPLLCTWKTFWRTTQVPQTQVYLKYILILLKCFFFSQYCLQC